MPRRFKCVQIFLKQVDPVDCSTLLCSTCFACFIELPRDTTSSIHNLKLRHGIVVTLQDSVL